MEKVKVRDITIGRLHGLCQRGERHDSFINRLLDSCEDKESINLDESTLNRLVGFGGSEDVDEALNMLMDEYERKKK